MRRAYSYIRFSSPEQAQGDSFRRQTEFSEQYAARNGLVLDESLSIRDLGVSAFRGANVKEGALAGFLEGIKSGRVPKGSVLIVESLDRLSRDQIRPALQLFMGILDAGVGIVTVRPERVYTPDDQDPLALVEPLIYFSRAHEESSTKSSRNEASWTERRRLAVEEQRPMTTVCPHWIELVDGKYRLVPERARVVRRVFGLNRDGLGTFAITKKFRQEGVPPIGRSVGWNNAYVRLMLTDKRAMGEYQPKKLVKGRMVPVGDPVPDYYPAAVTEAEFYAAAGTIKARKGKGGRGTDTKNLLKGLVWNADDGSKMYYCTQKKIAYLDSTAGYYGGECVVGRSFRYQSIEDCVLSLLTELTPATVMGTHTENTTAERVAELSGRLAEVNNKVEAVTEKARTAADFDVYLELLARLRADQKKIAGELEEAKTVAASGRVESVGEAQALIALCRTQKGVQLESLRGRLRNHIAALVESVWIKVEVLNRKKKIAHVQVSLRGGVCEMRYQVVYFPQPDPNTELTPATDYSKTAFRKQFAG